MGVKPDCFSATATSFGEFAVETRSDCQTNATATPITDATKKLARVADGLPNDGLRLANQSRTAMKRPARVSDDLPSDVRELANQPRAAVKKPARVRFARLPNNGLSLAI